MIITFSISSCIWALVFGFVAWVAYLGLHTVMRIARGTTNGALM